jgi:glucose 1-dehydrogenase
MPIDRAKPLQGQKAIVTGASSGIGATIARCFGAAGAAVGVNYRGNRESAEAIVREIRAGGSQAIALNADVSQEPAVKKMFAEFLQAFGRVDILVANAGIQRDAPFVEMSLE